MFLWSPSTGALQLLQQMNYVYNIITATDRAGLFYDTADIVGVGQRRLKHHDEWSDKAYHNVI